MTDINKEKFLTELGKLLTFMYEEDRQTALALYERMFDKAEDETALLQLLVSPTRQAVIVARAYNAKEHKLQVYTQSREEASMNNGEMPDFVRAINQIHLAAVAQHIIAPEVTSGQFTLFADDDNSFTETYAYEDGTTPKSHITVAPAPVYETAPAAAPEVPVQARQAALEVPVQARQAAPEVPIQVQQTAQEVLVQTQPAAEEPATVREKQVPAPEEPAPALVYGEAQAQEESPAQEKSPAPAADADTFVTNFSIPEESAAPETPEQEEAPLLHLDDLDETSGPEKPVSPVRETVRKPKVFLMILYIFFAVPVTLLGILLLLIPTLLCLALAAAVLGAGAAVLVAAFSGFKVFADIMVVLGVALIILALGILFLWLFVWFIGGAMVGLVRGVCSLGASWCYKEVPAV